MNDFNFPTVKLTYRDEQYKERIVIRCSRDIEQIAKTLFAECMQHHEECHAILLSTAGKVLGTYCLGVGASRECSVNCIGLYQAVILSNACACVLTHNHPSGQTYPSAADDRLTQRVKESLDLLQISLFDHLIISEDGYFSYADEGRL